MSCCCFVFIRSCFAKYVCLLFSFIVHTKCFRYGFLYAFRVSSTFVAGIYTQSTVLLNIYCLFLCSAHKVQILRVFSFHSHPEIVFRFLVSKKYECVLFSGFSSGCVTNKHTIQYLFAVCIAHKTIGRKPENTQFFWGKHLVDLYLVCARLFVQCVLDSH